MTLSELARYSSMSKSTLRKWLHIGMPFFKLGRSIRVRRSDFDSWVEQFRSCGTPKRHPALEAWDEVTREVQ